VLQVSADGAALHPSLSTPVALPTAQEAVVAEDRTASAADNIAADDNDQESHR
jgi:hypothetical protein